MDTIFIGPNADSPSQTLIAYSSSDSNSDGDHLISLPGVSRRLLCYYTLIAILPLSALEP
eukprot:14870324-Heterocapsa_arctica.AAC.1